MATEEMKKDVPIVQVRSTSTKERFDLMHIIGRGTFGKVYACVKQDGSQYAVKRMPKSRLLTLKGAARVAAQLRVLCQSDLTQRHPNILYFDEVLQSRSHIYMVMPHAGQVRSARLRSAAPRRTCVGLPRL